MVRIITAMIPGSEKKIKTILKILSMYGSQIADAF